MSQNRMYSEEDKLALSAALSNQPTSTLNWNELMGLVNFDEVSNRTIRIIPAIYENIKSDSDVLEKKRLKGAYQHTWMKNTKFLHTLIPIFEAFKTSNLNYRIVKGYALCLYLNSYGFRSMGDIDLVIEGKDYKTVSKILECNKFEQIFSSGCTHRNILHKDMYSTWRNHDNLEIDVHIPQTFHAHGNSHFFNLMLKDSPKKVDFSGLKLKIPSPEFMLVQSMLHGEVLVAETDQIQTIVDCGKLLDQVNLSKVLEISYKNNCLTLVERNLNFISEIKNERGKLRELSLMPKKVKILKTKKLINYHFLRNVRKLFSNRHAKPAEIFQIVSAKTNMRFIYKIWLIFLQIRVLEAWVISKQGGFFKLDSKQSLISPSKSTYSQLGQKEFKISDIYSLGQDLRFRFKFVANSKYIKFRLISEAFSTNEFLIFCNGHLIDVSRQSNEGLLEFACPNYEQIELSLRKPFRTCTPCAPRFEDLEIFVSL